MSQYLKRREETVVLIVPAGTEAGVRISKMNRFSPAYDTVQALQVVVENITDSTGNNLKAEVDVEVGVGITFSAKRPLGGVIKHAAESYWYLETENSSDYTFSLTTQAKTSVEYRVYFTAVLEKTK